MASQSAKQATAGAESEAAIVKADGRSGGAIMPGKMAEAASRLDLLKWGLVAALIVVGIYGNSYFAAESVLYRVIGLLALAGIAGWVASQTSKGAAFVTLCMEARTEIRKVVWPTRAETMQTTLIVVLVVIAVAIILWGLDSLLSWLTSLIIG